jgi:hypothetical protein
MMAANKRGRATTRTMSAADVADAMPADDRRAGQDATRPDGLPDVESGRMADDAVGGGLTPKIDGGNAQHPVHDEDQEDRMPSDYEREIDRIDAATRSDR